MKNLGIWLQIIYVSVNYPINPIFFMLFIMITMPVRSVESFVQRTL